MSRVDASERTGSHRIAIRPERPGDLAAIREVHETAFRRSDEARLVEAVRRTDRFVPGLSLVAEAAGSVRGHALFSWIHAVGADAAPVMALGPIGVAPACQNRGVGSALIEHGLAAVRALRCGAVAVLGDPAYYRRFGFHPAARYGVGPNVPEMMLLDLGGVEALWGRKIVYPAEFSTADTHDRDP